MNDNDAPQGPEDFQLMPGFGDPVRLLNMRNWLERAVTRSGAIFQGGSIGMEEADIDVLIEGHLFNISIRAIESRRG